MTITLPVHFTQGKIFEKMSDFLQEIEFVTFLALNRGRILHHSLRISAVITPNGLGLRAPVPDRVRQPSRLSIAIDLLPLCAASGKDGLARRRTRCGQQ
jgi:hypothetical protein